MLSVELWKPSQEEAGPGGPLILIFCCILELRLADGSWLIPGGEKSCGAPSGVRSRASGECRNDKIAAHSEQLQPNTVDMRCVQENCDLV